MLFFAELERLGGELFHTMEVHDMAKKKKSYRKKNTGGNKMDNITWGLVAGGAGQVLSKWIGQYGHPAAAMGVGYLKNKPILLTEGARELGAIIAQQLPFIGGGGGNAGGGYE